MARLSSTYLDLHEVAEQLGVSSRTVYRLINDGEIAADEVVIRGVRRRALRVSKDSLREFKRRAEREEVA